MLRLRPLFDGKRFHRVDLAGVGGGVRHPSCRKAPMSELRMQIAVPRSMLPLYVSYGR